ncbi:MAG: sigma-70 family RNA polymerase sigma factor [Chloroflexi bacterium]|nr:sigma-70 family RNA polymerase sigma factor [Chloroflexota bacterium]
MIDRERVWVEEALAGNEESFIQLADAYASPVYNLAYRMLGNAAEAEDAAQETFIRVYTRLHTYDRSRKFSSWLLSIASHHCIDRLRRRRDNAVSLDELPPWNEPACEGEAPVQKVIRREREETIRRLLDQLPPHYRLVMVLRYWYDLSYEEMAEVTGSTVSAIKSRLHRARLHMAELLTEERKRSDQWRPVMGKAQPVAMGR